MRSLSRRLADLEAEAAPPRDPVRIHLIGWFDAQSRAEAIAAYEQEGDPVEEGDGIIFLCGIKPATRSTKSD